MKRTTTNLLATGVVLGITAASAQAAITASAANGSTAASFTVATNDLVQTSVSSSN